MNNPAKELMNVMQSHPDVLDGIVDTNDVPAVLAERAYEYLRSYGDDLRTFEKDAFGYYCDSTDNVISIVPSKEGYKVRYSDNSEPVSKERYSKLDSSDQYAMEGGIGEWWLQNGGSEYADGELNHEAIASSYLRSDIADSIGHEYDDPDDLYDSLNLSEDSEHRAQAVKSGFDHDEIDAAAQIGNADPRVHAAKRYGWTRLAENEMQTYGLNRGKLQSIARELGEILAQHTDDEDVILKSVWNIEDASNGNYHKNVPFHVLESGDMKSLRDYRYNRASEDEEPDRYGMVMSEEKGIDHPSKLEPKIDENLYPEKEDFFEDSGVRGDYFDHEYHMSDENPDAMILDEDPTGHQDEGDLKTLYHGTASGEFPMHDRRFLGKPDRLLYGPGYYHTEDLGIAQKYMSKGSQSLETNFDVDYHGPKVIEELKEMAGDEEFVDGLSVGEKRRLKIASSVIKHLGKDAGFDGDEASVSRGSPAAAKAARKEIFKRSQLDIHGSSNRGQSKLSSELQKRVGYSSKYTKPTVQAVHLDIKNVFDADKDEIDFGDYLDYLVDRELIEDSDIDRLYKKYDSDGIQGLDMVDWDFVSDFLRDEQDEGELSPGFSVNQTLNHYLRKEGYDGITHIGGHIYGNKLHRVWIAFRPEQVKKVTNTNPTKDPRMDYSL